MVRIQSVRLKMEVSSNKLRDYALSGGTQQCVHIEKKKRKFRYQRH